MKRLLGLLAGPLLFLATLGGAPAPASATTCGSMPYNLTNGSNADASQVMANFDALLSCLNLNVMPVASPTFTGTESGANLSLSGTLAVGGTSTHTGLATFNGGLAGNLTGAVTGNASTATKLAAAVTIGTSGDVNCSATSFDGSASITLPNCNLPNIVGSASLGDGTHIPTLNVDTKGRITNGTSQTPVNLAGLISSNAATPGSTGVPGSGGTIYTNWGTYDCGSTQCWNSTATVNITPASCPNGILGAVATPLNPGGISGARYPTVIGGFGTGTLNITGVGASDEGFTWMIVCH